MMRMARAIRHRERIVILGDYDVDGIAATAILLSAIRICGGDVGWAIPHRLIEGYGLREQHVYAAQQKGATLIITADCGIRSFDVVQTANRCGIDVIITDHHVPDAEFPPALAIVNPNRRDSLYSNRHLCGAGLAFKFAAGIFSRMQIPETARTAGFLKVTAIATVVDVMPLVGENRAMVSLGLRGLADVKSPGLRLLLETAHIPAGRAPTAREVAFHVAPHINAADRLEDAALVMDLLTTRDPVAAASLVETLEKMNFRRKGEQARILDEIGSGPCPGESVLVFSGRGWHRGVLGIVAARLVEQFHRPVIVLSERDALAQGSGRSLPGIDLHALLERLRNLLEAFGYTRKQLVELADIAAWGVPQSNLCSLSRSSGPANPANRCQPSSVGSRTGMAGPSQAGAVRERQSGPRICDPCSSGSGSGDDHTVGFANACPAKWRSL
jgi:single-stranded-DNA-specific exonuclease